MSHYEERLERDLTRIRKHVADMAGHVETAVKNAMRALQTGDNTLAAATVLADHQINRTMREIDKLCHGFIALHLPSAGHLRLLSSVIRANIELERIGDYAATICREALQLDQLAPQPLLSDIEVMSGARAGKQNLLHRALEAFREGSADLAPRHPRSRPRRSARVECASLFSDLLREAELASRPLYELVRAADRGLQRAQRVADQAKNICEETIFAATGQTKPPKTYSILFSTRRRRATASSPRRGRASTTPRAAATRARAGRRPTGLDPSCSSSSRRTDSASTSPAPVPGGSQSCRSTSPTSTSS